MEGIRARIDGGTPELSKAVEAHLVAAGAEIVEDGPSVVVLLAAVSAEHNSAQDAIAGGLLGPSAQLQRAHGEFGPSGGRVVVVVGDPTEGSIASRAGAAAARSLVASLAVEWAPSTTFATVSCREGSDAASVARACAFAVGAPAGTTVEMGGAASAST
ncbi:MAG: hypothetical protein IT195_11870 [Microthrixaceae bacterium]|nr:hypothetical protein [Microthrixaceae bacterium]